MTMTQAAAVEEVRIRLDELTDGFFKDIEIRKWINEGVREVARRSEWKRTSSTVSVSVGTQIYSALATAIRIYRVEFQPTGSSLKYPLEYRDINQMDVLWGVNQSISAGIPAFFTMISANPLSIELAPVPAQAGQLNVFYYDMPADLATNTNAAASTALSVPMGWEDVVVEYATALGFRKSRDPDMYSVTMQAFESKINELIAMAERYTDAPTMIVPEMDMWGGGGWGY